MVESSNEDAQDAPRAHRVADGPTAAEPEAAESAAQGGPAGDGSVQSTSDPDENRDSSRGRLCAYTRCRAPLPIKSGRSGNRQKYCEDNKRWGSKALSCKQAALAVENYRSLFGDEQAVEVAVADLGRHVDQIDRAVEPITALRDALANAREQLDGPVAEAYAARDAALDQAGKADERAFAAQQQKEEAAAAAAEAESRAERSAQERHAAVRDRDQAVKAQTQAEARLTDAQNAKKDAEVRAEQANDAVHEAQQTITRLTGERDSLHAQVADLRSTLNWERTERQRLQEAHDVAQQQLQSERAEFKQSVERFYSETRDLRSENRQAMEQVQGLSGEKGRLEQQVEDLVQRVENTDGLLKSLSDELAAALDAPGENGEQLTACVERAVPHLRHPSETSTGPRPPGSVSAT